VDAPDTGETERRQTRKHPAWILGGSLMNELQRRIFTQETEDVGVGEADRRREPRTRIERPVYVQPGDPNAERFEEVRTMTDFSRNGLYFTTQRESYCEGMKLHVTPAFGCFNLEYVGKVVRVERLPSDEYGIAVQLLRIGNSEANASTPAKSAFQTFARVEQIPPALSQQDSDS
jgi:hypothetical protein